MRKPKPEDGIPNHEPNPKFEACWRLILLREPARVARLTLSILFAAACGATVRAAETPSCVTTNAAPASLELSNHLEQLRARLPRGFTWTWQAPFVVIGDEAPALVRKRSTNTVRWAVDLLKRDYFHRDPSSIIDIWLFKDKASYEKWARVLFDQTPTTPFGYYSPTHGALIMNIGTGGGTLVHEIVHPFMRANFAGCPTWFNEGLASLYEASGEQNGHIQGYPNWRLPSLQKAIRGGRVPPFATLMALSEDEFYGGAGNGRNYNDHYAQARYLCYFLQEQGLLVKFYKAYVADVKQDPTGVQTLKRVLDEPNLKAFQRKWEKFVLGLRVE
jgi:hypothetical protein